MKETVMPIISVSMYKPGSGKTTTAVNLAAGLQQQGKKVLLVDADPQANLTSSLGINEEQEKNLYTALENVIASNNGELEQVIIQTKSGLALVPSSIELVSFEIDLMQINEREKLFSKILQPLSERYDYIFIDCPSYIGMLTINALVASQFVLLPLQAEFLPMKGLQNFIRAIHKIKEQFNPSLKTLGPLQTKYDDKKYEAKQGRGRLLKEYEKRLFKTKIRTNIALQRAQKIGIDIFNYDKNSNGAQDYKQLALEFLKKMDQK